MTWRLDEFERSLTSVASATLGAYRRDITAFVAWCDRAGITEPSRVDRLVLRRYLAYLTTRRYARRSIARAASSLRRYFAWLRRTGVIVEDPARSLSAPKGDARLPHVLHADELHTLLDEPPAPTAHDPSPIRKRDDAVLELLYGSGLRVAELCSLDCGDVAIEARTITVWGKGGRQRRVPMSTPAADATRTWLEDGMRVL